eukprot:434470-Rhodomonas_salina.1
MCQHGVQNEQTHRDRSKHGFLKTKAHIKDTQSRPTDYSLKRTTCKITRTRCLNNHNPNTTLFRLAQRRHDAEFPELPLSAAWPDGGIAHVRP